MKTRSYGIAALALSLVLSFSALGQSRTEAIAITNARIVTVSGATIEKGTIVIRDGIIESVGADTKAPADARVIDATGLTVYPGIIDGLSLAGAATPPPQRVPGSGPPTQTAPTGNSNYPAGFQPEKKVIDDLRGGDSQFESQRGAGFTTVLTVGRDGAFNGQSAIVNLAGESVSAMVINGRFAQHFSFRSLPSGYPTSLIGTFSAFRQMILDARRLESMQKAYAANPRGVRRPESDASLEALIPVANGSMPIVFNANTENEIVRALDLAKELGLKAIIAGGQESGKLADRLKSQNVAVLLSMNFPKRTAVASPDADPESLDTLRFRAEVPKTAGILAAKGVRFGFQSGGATSLGDFFSNAAKATDNGLSKDAAVRAMTLSTAEILGIADRVGSIESGKIANLTVTRGDILAKDRSVTHVFVDGRLFEMRERPRSAPEGRTPPASSVSAAGTWQVTIEIPGQPLPMTMNLAQSGTTVTGTIQSDMIGSAPIKDGKINGDSVSFTASVSFGGTMIDLFVTGKINGNQISGTLESPQGTAPFNGSKNP